MRGLTLIDLRVALARAAFVGGGLAMLAVVMVGTGKSVLGSLFAGLAFGVAALIERAGMRFDSRDNYLLVAFATWGVAALGIAGISPQLAYSSTVLEGQDPIGRFEIARDLLLEPVNLLTSVIYAAPLPFLVFARLDKWFFGYRLALACAGGGVAAAILSAQLYQMELEAGSEVYLIGQAGHGIMLALVNVISAAALTVVVYLADRVSEPATSKTSTD